MIRLTLAALLIVSGLVVFWTATIGLFRFSTTLNRLHAAALCDTLGALLCMSGLALLAGTVALSLKIMLVVVLLWLCAPVSSHLIARAEVALCPDLTQICDMLDVDEDGRLVPGSIDGGRRR